MESTWFLAATWRGILVSAPQRVMLDSEIEADSGRSDRSQRRSAIARTSSARGGEEEHAPGMDARIDSGVAVALCALPGARRSLKNAASLRGIP